MFLEELNIIVSHIWHYLVFIEIKTNILFSFIFTLSGLFLTFHDFF